MALSRIWFVAVLLFGILACAGSDDSALDMEKDSRLRAELTVEGVSMTAILQEVGPGFFDEEQNPVWIGRTFLEEEFIQPGTAVIVFSQPLWQAFGASPSLLGARVQVDDDVRFLIGIMAPEFLGEQGPVAWIPEAGDQLPAPEGETER